MFQREIANCCPNLILNAPSRNDLSLTRPFPKPADGDQFASYVPEIDKSVLKKSTTTIETFAQPSPSFIIPIQRSATSVYTVTIDLCSHKDRNIDEVRKFALIVSTTKRYAINIINCY